MLVCAFGFQAGALAFVPGAHTPPGVPSLSNPLTQVTVVKNNAVADNIDQNIIKAHVVDEFGTPVANVAVTFTLGGYSFIYTTDGNGDAFFYFASPTIGVAIVNVSIAGAPFQHGNPASISFNPGPPDVTVAGTFLSIIANNAQANGVALNTVRAVVSDAYAHPLANQTVVFNIFSGTGTFVGSSSVVTDANGYATISLHSTVAGNVNVIASVNGNNITNYSPAIVKFVAGAPDLSKSLVSVVTDNALANNSATNSVRAHIVDAFNNPVPNASIVFAISSGTASFAGASTILTDASGNATVNLQSTLAGSVGVAATYSGSAINGSPVTVKFVAGAPDVSNPQTQLILLINNSKANGTAANIVRARIRDANGNPVPNATIVFSIVSGTGTFKTSATATTDASGHAVVQIVSTIAGQVKISATVNGVAIANQVTMTFVADVEDVTNPLTALSVGINNATANGTATNSVIAHIVDALGNPVSNASVTFTITTGTGTFTIPATQTTDAAGNATITLSSLVAGNVTITATVNGKNINGSATVTFKSDVPSTTNPATALSVVTNNAIANNTATNSVKAHVVDANGNPVPNTTVQFNIISGTGTIVGSGSVTTDANGDAIINITSTKSGNVKITATIGGSTITTGSPATVTFVPGPPATTNPLTALSVDKDNAVADGVAQNAVKAHVVDANGNPVSNAVIVFTIKSGTGTIVGTGTINTNANGDAIVSLTSTVVGVVQISATVNGTPINGGAAVSVNFKVDKFDPTHALSVLSVATNNATANGVATNSVKAHLVDNKGRVIAGETVTFSIFSGTGTLAGTGTAVSDVNGDAIITITSTVAGDVQIIANVAGVAFTNGSPAKVTFKPGAPDVTNPLTALSVVADNATANDVALNTVKAHVVDAFGNKVPNASVTFTIATGNGTFTGTATVTTDANGDAIISLHSAVVGTVDIKASVNGNAIGGTVTVHFKADKFDPTRPESILTIVTDNATADGVATNSVKAHLVDSKGNVVVNETVTFTILSGTGTLLGTGTAVSDVNGDAVITITSTVAGQVGIGASVAGVSFINGSPATVTFKPGAPDLTNPLTTLTVVANNAIANDIALNTVKAHVVDAFGNAVPNVNVTFIILSGTATFAAVPNITTDANGDAIISLHSSVIGNVAIRGVVNGLGPITKTVTVIFKKNTFDPDNAASLLTVVTTGAVANGVATNSVKAHVVDVNGDLMPNETVTFTIKTGTGVLVGGGNVTTDANGDAIITITSTVAGEVEIEANVGGIAVKNGSPAKVKFVAGPPDVTKALTALSVAADNAAANNTALNKVKAHIVDAFGNAVPNATVTFTIASGTGSIAGTATITTDANGDAIVSLRSNTAGVVTVTATVNSQAITFNSPASVTFKADKFDPNNPASVLTVVTDNAIANGVATNSVKAHLADAAGNSLAGETVTFSIFSGTGTLAGTGSVVSDANGDAVITLTSVVAGTVSIRAHVNGVYFIINSPVKVKFVAGPPDLTKSASALSVTTDNAAANNVAYNVVKAHIVDAFDNPVPNVTVVFTIASGVATFDGPFTITTNANGDANVALISGTVGAATVTATANGQPVTYGSPATVHFKNITFDPTNTASALSVVTTGAIADGVLTNSVKTHIMDINGNPLTNQAVTFTIKTGTATLAAAGTIVSDANGDAVITLTSVVAGEVEIEANVGGIAIVFGSPAKVKFVPGAPDVTNLLTALSVIADNAAANNIALNNVKAHVADKFGNAVPNATVVFTVANGTANIAGSATMTTDANGDVVVSLSSGVAGAADITATVNGVAFIQGNPSTVHFKADKFDPTKPASTLTVVTTGALANGVATNSVKAHLVDAAGNVLAGETVTFTIFTGTGTLAGTGKIVSDVNGDAVITLTSTVAGDVQITANVNGVAFTFGSPATVKFVPGVPDVTNALTALSVVSDNAVADDVALNAVKAHIVDAFGNAVPNVTVTFAIASGAGTFTGTATVTTDANGDALISLHSAVIGDVTLTADVNGQAITFGSPATVRFKTDKFDPTHSASVLTVVTTNAIADGVNTNSVKAHLSDSKGRPIANETVTFTITSGTGTIVGTGTVVSDANGDAVITITSTVAGEVGIGASVGSVSFINGSPAKVKFVPGAPDVNNIATELIIVADSAMANNIVPNIVRAHIVDAFGNVVPNATVVFSISTGTATIIGSGTVITDANGDAVISLTSPLVNDVELTASVEGTPIIHGSPAKVAFVLKPDVSLDDTRLIVLSNDAVADGVATNSVKAHIVDGNGAAMGNQPVFFKLESGNANVLTVQPVMTDANGDATILLSSTAPGSVSVTAKVKDDPIVNGSPAKLRFVAMDIYVPKIFTPNGDGKNDVVKAIVVAMPTFQYFSIYNRWGNLVFTTKDPNIGWDGKFKGVPQPVDSYIWIAEGLDQDKKKVSRKGMISLVR